MRRSIAFVIASSSFLVALVACGDDESQEERSSSTSSASTSGSTASTGGTGGSGGSGGGSAGLDVEWEPCSLDSNGGLGGDAECAVVDVPLDWADPSGERIEVFVKRWPVLEAPAPHHIWLVQGGPGEASVEYEPRVAGIGASFPEAQFYFRDPRGVGRSTRLSCPTFEGDASEAGIEVTPAEWPGCIDEVEEAFGRRLDFFTTSETARDLGGLVDAIRGDARVTLIGASYGTTLLQRYLHFFPDQAAAVILDSLANPGFPFTDFAERTDRVGHQYLDLCAGDAGCAARLGDDPGAFTDATFTSQLDDEGCAEVVAGGIDRGELASIFYVMLTLTAYRPLIPAVVHRLARCNADDVDALLHMETVFGDGPPDLSQRLRGRFLYHHIVFSEAWPQDAPSAEEYRQDLADNAFGLLDPDLEALAPSWPVYPPEPLADRFPDVDLPMLLANGTLDAQTPLEEALVARDHYAAANQTFIIVPGAPHGAIGGEAWSEPSLPCSVQITEAFVREPTATLDTSCLDDVDPVSFEPTADAADLFFGTPDAWGDGDLAAPPKLSPFQRAAAVAELHRAIRRLKAR